MTSRLLLIAILLSLFCVNKAGHGEKFSPVLAGLGSCTACITLSCGFDALVTCSALIVTPPLFVACLVPLCGLEIELCLAICLAPIP